VVFAVVFNHMVCHSADLFNHMRWLGLDQLQGLIGANDFERFFVCFFVHKHVCIVAVLRLLILHASVRVVNDHCAIVVVFLTECLVLHLAEIETRNDGVVEFQPRLLISFHPLSEVLLRVTLSLDIDIADVVAGIGHTHVDHHTNKLVIKLRIA